MQGWLRVCAVRVLSLGGADEGIGAEGAATVARALESGRCGLTSLNLGCEWDRWYLDYHCAALYRNAVLGCFQPRFVTVLASVVSGQERQ